WGVARGGGGGGGGWRGVFLDWRGESRSFESRPAFTASPLNLTGDGEPLRLLAAFVTESFNDVLGVAPQIGRALGFVRAGGDAAGAPALISDRLWRTRFAGDPRVAGRALRLDASLNTIVGVMPPGFSFPRELLPLRGARTPSEIDVWLPVSLRAGYRSNAFLQVVARLKSGVSIGQAQLEMKAIASRLAERFVEDRNTSIVATPLHERLVAAARPLILMLFGAVA